MKHFAIIAVALLAACATQPTVQELASADYGAPPPANYRQLIEVYFSSTLLDPASAQYRSISQPMRDYVVTPNTWYGYTTTYGYRVDAVVNAKNRMGGYTGFQVHRFLFRDGRIVHVDSP